MRGRKTAAEMGKGGESGDRRRRQEGGWPIRNSTADRRGGEAHGCRVEVAPLHRAAAGQSRTRPTQTTRRPRRGEPPCSSNSAACSTSPNQEKESKEIKNDGPEINANGHTGKHARAAAGNTQHRATAQTHPRAPVGSNAQPSPHPARRRERTGVIRKPRLRRYGSSGRGGGSGGVCGNSRRGGRRRRRRRRRRPRSGEHRRRR